MTRRAMVLPQPPFDETESYAMNDTTRVAEQLLQQIATDLTGDNIVFPTCFELTMRIRALLKNPDVSFEKVASTLSAEPLMSTRILAMANSVAMNRSGAEITNLKAAITRIGLEKVRAIAYAVAMAQLMRSRHMAPFHELSRNILQHSVVAAAAARVMSRRFPCGVSADHAMHAGLVHDMGAFYVLFRAAEDPALAREPETVAGLVADWHDGVGAMLLGAMGMEEDVVVAAQDHESTEDVPKVEGMRELMMLADRFAHQIATWRMLDYQLDRKALLDLKFDDATQAGILEEIGEEAAALESSLG